MSELGNILRSLRGPHSQKHVARGAGISLRTVVRAESDSPGTSLETVRALSQYFTLTKPEHAALIVAWLRLELGQDFALLDFKPRGAGHVRLSDFDRLIEQFRQVPRHLQRELAKAIKHKEVLNSIAHLNDLAERMALEANTNK